MTHCQVLSPSIIARMKAIGAVANVQPSFVPTDMR
jgi:predicted amidohydrolase YtcJ